MVLLNAETGNRTQDTTIFSRVLYQLSYLGKFCYFNRMLKGCQDFWFLHSLSRTPENHAKMRGHNTKCVLSIHCAPAPGARI